MKLLNFAEYKWSTPFTWRPLLKSEQLPYDEEFGSAALCFVGDTQIAVFRSAENKLFASQNLCGHRIAFVLSEGTVEVDKATNETYVICPLHRRKFFLDGERKGHTKSKMSTPHSIATFPVKEEDGQIWVDLPSGDELDAVLGTHRWQPPRPKFQSGPPKLSPNIKPTSPPSAGFVSAANAPSHCATTCGSRGTKSTLSKKPPCIDGSASLPACHRVSVSDTESDVDESLSSKSKEQYEAESDPECPVAATERLSW